MNLELGQQRNRLVTLKMGLNGWAASLGMLLVVGSTFGMNLTSHLEEHPQAFMQARGYRV